jgi:hypothetical protein
MRGAGRERGVAPTLRGGRGDWDETMRSRSRQIVVEAHARRVHPGGGRQHRWRPASGGAKLSSSWPMEVRASVIERGPAPSDRSGARRPRWARANRRQASSGEVGRHEVETCRARLRARLSPGANDRRPTHDPLALSPSDLAPILGRAEAQSSVRGPRYTSACSAARCTHPVSTRSWPKAAAASSRWVQGAELGGPGQLDRYWLRSKPTAPGRQPKRRTLGMSSPLRSPPPDAS